MRDRRYYFTEPEQREGVLYKLREAEVRCSVLCGEDSVVVMRTLPVWVCTVLVVVRGRWGRGRVILLGGLSGSVVSYNLYYSNLKSI